jgi:hypothetical protein
VCIAWDLYLCGNGRHIGAFNVVVVETYCTDPKSLGTVKVYEHTLVINNKGKYATGCTRIK